MRDIKFRAWDKNKKEMQFNNFCITASGNTQVMRSSPELQRAVDRVNKKKGEILGGDYAEIDFTDWYGINEMVVMQYTGLKDKNGKDAYEDDIIDTWPFYKHQGNCKGKKRYQRITFNTGMLVPENFDFGWEGEGTVRIEHCEIIGNIYEHPHLLNQGEELERSVATESQSGD